MYTCIRITQRRKKFFSWFKQSPSFPNIIYVFIYNILNSFRIRIIVAFFSTLLFLSIPCSSSIAFSTQPDVSFRLEYVLQKKSLKQLIYLNFAKLYKLTTYSRWTTIFLKVFSNYSLFNQNSAFQFQFFTLNEYSDFEVAMQIFYSK